MSQLSALLEFVKEADRLKLVERQTLIHAGGRRENSAEHSWHLALSVLVFSSLAPKGLDLFKAVRMALVHDLVEIDAGDELVYGENKGKQEKELKAIERLSAILPGEAGSSLKADWLEFEEGKSPEAKFVSALDRFLPIFSNYFNGGHSWKNHGVPMSKVVGRCEGPISEIPGLWEATQAMLEECVSRGELAR